MRQVGDHMHQVQPGDRGDKVLAVAALEGDAGHVCETDLLSTGLQAQDRTGKLQVPRAVNTQLTA